MNQFAYFFQVVFTRKYWVTNRNALLTVLLKKKSPKSPKSHMFLFFPIIIRIKYVSRSAGCDLKSETSQPP